MFLRDTGLRMVTVDQFKSRYELLGKLGTGSYGQTFSARVIGGTDPSEIVAVKVSYRPETSREPWLLQHCQHPNVVKLLDFRIPVLHPVSVAEV